MAPARTEEPPVSWPTETDGGKTTFKGQPRNIGPIDALKFDDNLQPKHYDIFGTHPDSKVLFLDVNILDSTGKAPYRGDVLIQGMNCARMTVSDAATDCSLGEKITAVGNVPHVESLKADSKVRVFHGKGRTLMSGLGDAHTHFTWNGGDLDRLGELQVEEHTLLTMRSAQCYIDSGYTMFGPRFRLDLSSGG